MARRRKILLLVAILALVLVAAAIAAPRVLMVDAPERADAIIVLAGDRTDARYRKGLEMFRAGYGKTMFVNASADYLYFGHAPAEYAQRFVQETAGVDVPRVKVCPIWDNSTWNEAAWAAKCLRDIGAKKGLIVTSAFHTRRARAIFRKSEPQFEWSVAAAEDPAVFGMKWWTRREWAKTIFDEGTRLFWWYAIDQWRQPAHTWNHSSNMQSP